MKRQTQVLILVMTTTLFAFASLAKKDFAEELSKTMLPKEQYDQMISGIVQTGTAMAQAKIDQDKLKVDAAKETEKMEKTLRSTFTYQYFIDMNTKTMKKNFSEAELQKILDFYETTLGKKWVKHTPEIISETMTQVQLDLQDKLPKLVEAIGGKKKAG